MNQILERSRKKLAILGVLLAISFGNAPKVKARETGNPVIDTQITRIGILWKHGDASDSYDQAAAVTKKLIMAGPRNWPRETASLLRIEVGMWFSPNDSCVTAISGTGKLAMSLIRGTNTSPIILRENAKLLADYLGWIRSQLIPNFQKLSVVANVNPPPGIFGFSGMDPNAISDPVAKSKYLKAIEANQNNNLTNQWQDAIAQIDKRLKASIVNYISKTARDCHVPNATLERWMLRAQLNEGEKQNVRDAILRAIGGNKTIN